MATNPYVNKVQKADGTTILDISDSTALASDVAQGKYFYLATGEKVQGTATGGGGAVWQDQDGYVHLSPDGSPPITVEALSVTQNGTYTAPTGKAYSPVTVSVSGGGGLEYESGTWSPTNDSNHPTINFTNTHTTLPTYVVIVDADAESATPTYSVAYWTIVNWYAMGISILNTAQSNSVYGRSNWMNFSSSGGLSYSGSAITALSGGVSSAMDYYITTTGIKPATGSSYYFRAGRTYKWIAVWAPTT